MNNKKSSRNNLMRSLVTFVMALGLMLSATAALSQDTTNRTTYYHNTIQGTPVAATDESGAVKWSQTYSSYGFHDGNNQEVEESSLVFGTSGHVEDQFEDNLLVYQKARYYNPALGRFMSIDPVGFTAANPQSFNRYAYVNNNPTTYVDPDGRFPFLIPVVIFLGKEIAAELASEATGGATDFLSVRRLGTKAVKAAVKGIKSFRKCSFDGDTEVLTDHGYLAIKDIAIGSNVLSRDEHTGEQAYNEVRDRFLSTYEQTVYISILDGETNQSSELISSTVHPIFAVRFGGHSVGVTKPVSTRNYEDVGEYKGSIPNGQWVAAAELLPGDLLLNAEGGWSKVTEVVTTDEPLIAYNLDVDAFDSFFVRAAGDDVSSVWVHNNNLCDPKPLLGNNPKVKKDRTNTDLDPVNDRSTAKSIFRNQTKDQQVRQFENKNGDIIRRAEDGTQIRMNRDGSTRIDLPGRGSQPNGETVHFNP